MKLYVGNLPFRATEEDIQSWFSQAGINVDTVSIIRDRFSSEPRGFGFIEVSDSALAEQAIRTCNGKEMMGRSLVVNEARPAGSGSAGAGARGRSGERATWAGGGGRSTRW
jgi:RNA recognition motif-containing protein